MDLHRRARFAFAGLIAPALFFVEALQAIPDVFEQDNQGVTPLTVPAHLNWEDSALAL
jgi:hypothetical protein